MTGSVNAGLLIYPAATASLPPDQSFHAPQRCDAKVHSQTAMLGWTSASVSLGVCIPPLDSRHPTRTQQPGDVPTCCAMSAWAPEAPTGSFWAWIKARPFISHSLPAPRDEGTSWRHECWFYADYSSGLEFTRSASACQVSDHTRCCVAVISRHVLSST